MTMKSGVSKNRRQDPEVKEEEEGSKGPGRNKGDGKGPFTKMRKRKGEESADTVSKKKPRAYENIVDAQGRPDWSKLRLERKRLKEARKKKDKRPEIYELSKEAKKLWEDLRKGNCDPTLRKKLCDQLHHLVKDHIKKLAFAHDTARILETLLQYGTEEIKNNIFSSFAAKEDLLLLMKSKYGHFLVLKMFSRSELDQNTKIFEVMEPHIVQLIKHQFASKVLSEYYTHHAKAVQKSVIVKECYAPLLRLDKSVGQSLKSVIEKQPERKSTFLKNVHELLTFMLGKNMKSNPIFQLLMHEYLENCDHSERADFIAAVREELVNILHSAEGSFLAMSCLWHGTPKDRKAIVKSLKGSVAKIACDKHGYLVLLAAIDVIDDVVLLSKAIGADIINNINELVLNPFGQRTVSYMVEHRNPWFFDPEICKLLSGGDNNEFTKKPIAQRLKDIVDPMANDFLSAIVDNFGMWIKENSPCLLVKLMLKRFADHSLSDALTKIAGVFVDTPTGEGIERTPVEQLSKYILCELPEDARMHFATTLLECLSKDVTKVWLNTNRGCFTFVRIIEKCGQDSPPSKKIKEFSSSANVTTAGGKLLKKLTV